MSAGTARAWVGRIQPYLDLVATLAIIAIGVVTLARTPGQPAPPRQNAGRAQPSTPAVPKDPIALPASAMLGSPSAGLALVEYSDFQCPYCAQFARDTLPQLRRSLIDTGRLVFAFKYTPLSSIHPMAVAAAQGAECAGRQGRFWPMHDRLFADPKQIDESFVARAAQDLGLDRGSFADCLRADGAARVTEDAKLAESLGITGTPTFMLGRVLPDQRVKVLRTFVGAQTAKQFEDAVADLESALTHKPVN